MISFPRTTIASTLPSLEYDRLVKLLAVHYAYPLPYPLAGTYFEELFASAVSGEREKRKLLFDVLRGRTGWSLKTAQQTKSRGDLFEVVIQRCNILKDQDRTITLDSPIEVLGERIVEHFNKFALNSYATQDVEDPRAGFLIRDNAEHSFIFFQRNYSAAPTCGRLWL